MHTPTLTPGTVYTSLYPHYTSLLNVDSHLVRIHILEQFAALQHTELAAIFTSHSSWLTCLLIFRKSVLLRKERKDNFKQYQVNDTVMLGTGTQPLPTYQSHVDYRLRNEKQDTRLLNTHYKRTIPGPCQWRYAARMLSTGMFQPPGNANYVTSHLSGNCVWVGVSSLAI